MSFNSNRKITIRDIAELTGYHFTTVAEALRDSKRVKLATRDVILKKAKELGYRKDPLLSALSSYRSKNVNKVNQGLLHWLEFQDNSLKDNKICLAYLEYKKGAVDRAKDMGYMLESYTITNDEKKLNRYRNILYARNVQGVLIPPVSKDNSTARLDVIDIPMVRFGYSLALRGISRVSAHQYNNCTNLYKVLREKGFNRIGFADSLEIERRVNDQFLGAFLKMNLLSNATIDIKPFLEDIEGQHSKKKFIEYVVSNKLDAVICTTNKYYECLIAEGIKIPKDLSVAVLSKDPSDEKIAGIYECSYKIGQIAIDMLLSIIKSNQYSDNQYSYSSLVTGEWQDGESVAL